MQEHESSDRAWTRREFIARSGLTVAGIALAGAVEADEPKKGVTRIGTGHWTYEVVDDWGALPPEMSYGFGCGVVVDAKDRVYVHSRSKQAMAVFDRKGKLLTTWGAEYAGVAHGLYWSKEGHDEFLYLTTNTPGDMVFKTDLNGKVLMAIGSVPHPGATNIEFKFNNPTDVAIAPNGDIYVCEGYGSQLIHRFTKEGKHVTTMGGPGTAPDKFNTCHGIWVDMRKGEPEIYIADRANARLQVFTPELTFKRSLTGVVRNPCCFYTSKKAMFVPDLDHRVTIFDEHDQVLAQLGDGKGKDDKVEDPSVFKAPHALTIDSKGDMYVVEWVPTCRLRKLKHTPQKA